MATLDTCRKLSAFPRSHKFRVFTKSSRHTFQIHLRDRIITDSISNTILTFSEVMLLQSIARLMFDFSGISRIKIGYEPEILDNLIAITTFSFLKLKLSYWL